MLGYAIDNKPLFSVYARDGAGLCEQWGGSVRGTGRVYASNGAVMRVDFACRLA